MAQRSRLHGLLCNFIKSSGYVRGYLPELLSRVTSYTGAMPRGSNNSLGKLALISTIAAGAYYLYNKYKKNEQEKAEDDDANYTNVPDSVKANGPTDSVADWGRDYYWDNDDDESDYDYSMPPVNPSYSGVAPEVKTSAYKPRKVSEWLYK